MRGHGMVGTGVSEERRRCLLRAWYARCFEDEKMEECVDGSKSCFETTHNLLDFSVIEAYSSSGPKTNVFEYCLEGKRGLRLRS
jgi:hypothetical protein